MKQKKYSFWIAIVLLFSAVAVWAHEDHKKSKPQSRQEESHNANPATKTNEVQQNSEAAVREKSIPLPFTESAQEHLHNKLVHVPLGFGIAGVLFAFITLKKPEMLTAVRVLWFLAALGAVGAYFTGEAQEEAFEDDPYKHEVVELHEKLGIATGISFAVGFLISLSRRLKGLAVVWSVIVLLLLSVAGYYGGLLAHT